MHERDQIPVFIRHILESLVAEDTGIIDEDVHGAKGVDGGFDDGLA